MAKKAKRFQFIIVFRAQPVIGHRLIERELPHMRGGGEQGDDRVDELVGGFRGYVRHRDGIGIYVLSGSTPFRSAKSEV